jgi:membrane-associated phospholipid phosphatase
MNGGLRRVILPVCLILILPFRAVQAQTLHTLEPGKEAALLGTGVILHGFGLLQQHAERVRPLPLLDPAQVPAVDRIALRQWHPAAHRSSNLLFGVAAASSFMVAIINQHGEQPLLPAVILLEGELISSGLTNSVKHLVRRPRPYLYNSAVPATAYHPDDDDLSFWSGHTANTAALTFGCAALVQHSNAPPEAKTATWIGAAVAPAAMGYLRVRAGRHFPTDVVVGYAMGAAVGLLVPMLHRSTRPE